MTTFFTTTDKCSICGTVSEFASLGSSNQFGSPDLDLRPAPMMRDTMSHWYEECPNCGYISRKVSDPSSVDIDFLKSEEYRTCDGFRFESKLAEKFYKYYKIKIKDQSIDKAFDAILHAAWACDDANDTVRASYCRKLAVLIITAMITVNPDNSNLLLIKADLLRRSGCFEQLITEYQDVKFDDPLLDQILAFQLDKARQQDTKCYRVIDVTKE